MPLYKLTHHLCPEGIPSSLSNVHSKRMFVLLPVSTGEGYIFHYATQGLLLYIKIYVNDFLEFSAINKNNQSETFLPQSI